jgi:hypothetical protein
MRGGAVLVRYADDAVLAFSMERDALRVMDVLPKRFGKYNLRLHPTKTRLVPFVRPPLVSRPHGPEGEREPGSFDLLGFTHYWSRSTKGHWVIKRRTAKGRLNRAIKAVSRWCRENRHVRLADCAATIRPVCRRQLDLWGRFPPNNHRTRPVG